MGADRLKQTSRNDEEIKKSIIQKFFPKGRENALHQKELAEIHDIKPQEVKELAIKGRIIGVPVLSDSCGYWVSDKKEEIQKFVHSHEKYGRTCFKSVKALKETLKVIEGQESLELEEAEK